VSYDIVTHSPSTQISKTLDVTHSSSAATDSSIGSQSKLNTKDIAVIHASIVDTSYCVMSSSSVTSVSPRALA
jgi:hypothetical protein